MQPSVSSVVLTRCLSPEEAVDGSTTRTKLVGVAAWQLSGW